MLYTNNRYKVTQIGNTAFYIEGNFKVISVQEIVNEIFKDPDSNNLTYTIDNNGNGVISCNKGIATYYTTTTPQIIPFFLRDGEFIDTVMTRKNLYKIRKSAKLTQKELSDISGLSAQCISNIESEESEQSPTLRTVVKYLNCLGYEIGFNKKK